MAAVPQIVGLTMLMENPEDFVRMPHQIGRKLQSDREIDLDAHELGNIEQTRCNHVVEDRLCRIPFERHCDDFRLMVEFA